MTINKIIRWEKSFPPLKDDDEEDLVNFKSGYGEDLPSSGKFISGPNGITPIDSYNIWVGHTNFEIKDSDIKGINKIDGVEICRGITRYRFEVCIGKLFNSIQVKKDIKQQLCKAMDNAKSFFVVIKHEGKVFSVFGKSPEEVAQKVKPYGNVELIKQSW